ncbi:hypothetical protein LTR85_007579 [Meristemomyces frigidus]|nr:hypothetical protein LTR85_007579 [Meristemomyces frigidus]
MECLDELELMAASSAQVFAEPDQEAVERWQRIFGYSAKEGAVRLAEQRQELMALVSDSLWQLARQHASGHDRESYSHWLRLPQSNAILANPGERQSDRQYLLRLDGPLDSVDEDAKQAILQWVAHKQSDYRPLFISHSPARKDFCAHSLYPELGCDTTLPQHRLSHSSITSFAAEPLPRPAQDEYPVWYFFYGTLASTQKLRELLHHLDGSPDEEYELYRARVSRARLTNWGHYLGVKDGDGPVHGSAFLVRTKAEEETLMSYETNYETSNLVAGFRNIAAEHAGYEEVAAQILVDNFTSISDSVNLVDGIPLNTTMTTSRAQLLQQVAKLPPTGTVTDLFISHTCDTITWYFEFGTAPLPTRGIAILFVNSEKKIYKAYREVNNAALLYNIGKPECASNFTATVGNMGPKPSNSTCKSYLAGGA